MFRHENEEGMVVPEVPEHTKIKEECRSRIKDLEHKRDRLLLLKGWSDWLASNQTRSENTDQSGDENAAGTRDKVSHKKVRREGKTTKQ